MAVLLRITDLHRCYGAKEVLRGISFEAQATDCVAVIGRNGSGKTTLLRVLATLLLPTSGDVQLAGYSIVCDPERVRSLIGWSPATDGGFFPRLSGKENLFLFGALRGLRQDRILRFIDRWKGLEVFTVALETRYYLCSSGMKQILQIMRALLCEPSMLLLDEPTRSLDEESAAAIREIIREVSSQALVLFSSHQESEIACLATKRLSLAPSLPGELSRGQ